MNAFARQAAAILILAALAVWAIHPFGRAQDKSGDSLDGKWAVTSLTEAGKQAPDEMISLITFHIQGDKLTLLLLGKSEEGTFRADLGKNPKQFEMTLKAKAKSALGIYKIEKDVLTLCFSEDKQERPTKFESLPGSRHILIVLKRGEAKVDSARAKELTEKLQEAAQRANATNQLKQIGLAMHIYHDTNNSLPPAAVTSKDGKPLLSWRVLILPYLEQDALFKQFKLDEPWDSPNNKKLLEKIPAIYAPVAGKPKESNSTYYRVFTGPGTAFEGDKGLSFRAFTDGTSNTAMVVEARDAVPWSKPDELPYQADKDLPPLGGQFKDVFLLATCDGAVRYLPTKVDPALFRLVITRNDGKMVNWDKIGR